MVDSSSLLLYLYLALVFCHAAGAGGGGLEPGLLGTSAAGGRITSLRVRANDGMRKRQDGIMPLRGGADFRTYKKSKYDSSDEDEEEKLPPQLEHDVPWKIDTVDKDDVKDEPYEIQERREDYDAELEGISMMAFNSTLTGADEMMPQEAIDAVKDMHERGDYRGVSRELERQIRSRLNMWHLHDPMHDPSNPRPEPKTIQECIQRLIEIEIGMANPEKISMKREELRRLSKERASSLGTYKIEAEESSNSLDDPEDGVNWDAHKVFGKDPDDATKDFINVSQSLEEQLADIGVYSIPIATAEDFVRAEAEMQPTGDSAWDAWDMVKCKDTSGFDIFCLRHSRWGTEVEFSITSMGGAIFVKPDAKHGAIELFADGTYLDFVPGEIEFECQFVFDFLRNNTGCGWLEAMGGADGYMLGKQEPAVPVDHLQHVDRDTLTTNEGWTPATDRWSDVDKFDTAYRRTFAKEILPEVYDVVAIGPQKGHWTVREAAGRLGRNIVWSNDECLCELVLTPEGLFFTGARQQFLHGTPQAIRIEYGLGGCVEGSSTLFKMPLPEARALLGQGAPDEIVGQGPLVDALRNWTVVNGWHRLRERLFDWGRDSHQALTDIQKDVFRVQRLRELTDDIDFEDREHDEYLYEVTELMTFKALIFQDFDENDYPARAVDKDSGEVLWEKNQPIKYANMWAREGLVYEKKGDMRRLSRSDTGEPIAQWCEGGSDVAGPMKLA